jgi:hypothetical protein
MPLEQLLAREHGPEVGVVLPDERDDAWGIGRTTRLP